MSLSVAIALLIGVVLHFNPDLGMVGNAIHDIGNGWVWSRNLVSYQAYFVAGMVVAFHSTGGGIRPALASPDRDGLRRGGSDHALVHSGDLRRVPRTRSASDVFEPIAVLWSLGAIAGILCAELAVGSAAGQARCGCSSDGARRAASVSQAQPRLLSITYLAELTGGFYFCHILFLNMVRAILYSNFIGGSTGVADEERDLLRGNGGCRSGIRVADCAHAPAVGPWRSGTSRTAGARQRGGGAAGRSGGGVSGDLELKGSGVTEALTNALAGPGDELFGFVQHEIGVDGVVP